MNNLLTKFKITDEFFGRYEKLISETVIPYQEKILKDMIPDAEKSHAIENFKQAAMYLKEGKCKEEFYGMVFQDSDVAKWLEAAAYSISMFPNTEMEAHCDEIIDLIGTAQHEDGYLNTYFTVKEPGKRWTDLTEAHELYCAGHMMEAATAYYKATGKKKLLDIMCKMADHIYEKFIVEGKTGYPGHPEVELALMRMYETTGNEKYLELAYHFVNVRGIDSDYFENESKERGWFVWNPKPPSKEYGQNHLPVREQDKAVGHAVRAVYLYTGMAHVGKVKEDKTLVDACKVLWNNMVNARMYITGAIGSAYEGEAFTKDYHLPNDTAYAETCASIGLIFFGRKMLDFEKKGNYGDVMEKALYNCVLAGMQLDGQRFFYVNPLEVIPGISGEAETHKHSLPQRPKWFGCACCPPNVARLLPSIADYAWIVEEDVVYSNMFIGGVLNLNDSLKCSITTETKYPYENQIKYRINTDEENINFTMALRVPGYSKENSIELNGKECRYIIKDGFAYISGPFSDGDELTLTLDFSVKRVFASSKVADNNGRTAFTRGPIVYCAEGSDNDMDVLSLYAKKDGKIIEKKYDSDKLNGIVEISIEGYKAVDKGELYSYERPEYKEIEIKMIPYYTWGNRELNQMRVWIPEL